MKIRILTDNQHRSLAKTIPGPRQVTLELVRTQPIDAERECYICKAPIGEAPGWKTMFNNTSYHEACLEVIS